MIALLLVTLLPTALCSPSARVIGGHDVDIADFPWQGSYRTGTGSHTCGCVFVGGAWVLTAGHCGGSSAYSMEFGGTDRGTGTVFDVSTVTLHPEYDLGEGLTPNDIAVVQATTDISGTNIVPGTIAPDPTNPERLGWITGWGRTCGDCDLPITLQGLEIAVIPDDNCDIIFESDFQRSNMICVWGGVGSGIGACNGDGGGPFSLNSIIYGLTSWGGIMCGTNLPSVYNRVGAMRDFICSTTELEASGC